ncbi:MAG: hypothetical protein ACE5GG_01930 [Candidatus Omnitrophota bacterium]
MVGRQEEPNKLEGLLISGQSVVLTSPRRYGKASHCLELLARLKKRKCDELLTLE